jgi:hypothetical protein
MTPGIIQRQIWRPFHKTSSKTVSKGGLGAGIGAELPKRRTLKATTVIFSNEVCSTFTAISSRNSLSNHVYIKSLVFTQSHLRDIMDCHLIFSVHTVLVSFKISSQNFKNQWIYHFNPQMADKLNLDNIFVGCVSFFSVQKRRFSSIFIRTRS